MMFMARVHDISSRDFQKKMMKKFKMGRRAATFAHSALACLISEVDCSPEVYYEARGKAIGVILTMSNFGNISDDCRDSLFHIVDLIDESGTFENALQNVFSFVEKEEF